MMCVSCWRFRSTAIVLGISFGYEDPEIAANRTRVGRVALGESVRFCG